MYNFIIKTSNKQQEWIIEKKFYCDSNQQPFDFHANALPRELLR